MRAGAYRRGADLDVRDGTFASSPVLWARNAGHEEMIELLLARGARLNAPDAAKLGLSRIVSGFLDDVPDSINAAVGWPTPLISAVSNGYESTCGSCSTEVPIPMPLPATAVGLSHPPSGLTIPPTEIRSSACYGSTAPPSEPRSP